MLSRHPHSVICCEYARRSTAAAAPLLNRPLTAVFVSATAWSIVAARSPGLLNRAVDVVRSWTAGAAPRLTRRPFGTRQAIDDGDPANEVLRWHANECFLFDGGRQLQREA